VPQETVPEQYGEYMYWTRQSAAAPRAVLLRRADAGGPEEVVLDTNALPDDAELGQACLRSLATLAQRESLQNSARPRLSTDRVDMLVLTLDLRLSRAPSFRG